MDVRCKQRAVIEFLYHEGIKEAEIVERLRKVYKDKALSQATVWRWLDRFKSSVLNEDSAKLIALSYKMASRAAARVLPARYTGPY